MSIVKKHKYGQLELLFINASMGKLLMMVVIWLKFIGKLRKMGYRSNVRLVRHVRGLSIGVFSFSREKDQLLSNCSTLSHLLNFKNKNRWRKRRDRCLNRLDWPINQLITPNSETKCNRRWCKSDKTLILFGKTT